MATYRATLGYARLKTFRLEYAGAADAFRIDVQFIPGIWTNLRADVVASEPIRWRRGLASGAAPTDRTAQPGGLEFTLRNDAGNLIGLQGAYSPNHVNCRSGFTYGIPVRVVGHDTSDHVLWTGKIRTIDPAPGRYRTQRTVVTAQDTFADLAEAQVRTIPAQVTKDEAELLQAILDALPDEAQPAAVDLDTGLDVYPYALYNTGGGAQAIGLINDMAVSALGFVYGLGDGTFVYENRHTRTLKVSAFTFDVDTDGDGLVAPSSLAGVYNRTRVTIHPPTVTAGIVLWSATGATTIAAGDTVTIWGSYADPTNEQQLIGGTGFVTPVAGTDYVAHANPDGSGSVLTANLTVVATPFAATVKFELTNTGGVALSVGGPAGVLQLRGSGIFDQAPQTFEAYSAQPYGDRPLEVDLPYQDDASIAQDMADLLNALYSARQAVHEAGFKANRSDALMTQALTREIGDAITISETVIGLAARQVVIQGIAGEITNGQWLRIDWSVGPQGQASAFVLDHATLGVLDTGLLAYA